MSAGDDLTLAQAEREQCGLALVLVRDGEVIATGERGGVLDLLQLLRERAPALRGASLADRVVGRAAAMLARSAGIASVHAALMSEAGAEALAEAGIEHSADRRVPHVLNRAGTDLCPLERLSLRHTDPLSCHAALEEFVAQSSRPPR